MSFLNIEVTTAAQACFLRRPPLSLGRVVIRTLAAATRYGAPHITLPALPTMGAFDHAPRRLAFDDADFARLVSAAREAGFESVDDYASQLLHALHMRAQPEGTQIVRLTVQTHGTGSLTPTIELPLRMTNRGRALQIGTGEFHFRGTVAAGCPFLSLTFKAAETVDAALATLRQEVDVVAGNHLGDFDPLVAVRRVGAGPTEKSGRFALVAIHTPRYGTAERREHTFTMAASLLREIDGQQYMPAWAVNKKLREKKVDEIWVEAANVKPTAAEALYAALAAVLTECIETAMGTNEAWLAGATAREAKAKADTEKAVQAQAQAAERAKENDASDAERKARLAAKKAAREPDRELIGVRVIWPEWIGPSNRRRRVDHDDAPCSVRFFGSKREITLPDGSEIVKMAGAHLKILEQVAQESAIKKKEGQ